MLKLDIMLLFLSLASTAFAADLQSAVLGVETLKGGLELRATSTTPCQLDWPSVEASSSYYCSQTTAASAFTAGYTVTSWECGTQTLARTASGLGAKETGYADAHKNLANEALDAYLSRAWKDSSASYPIPTLMATPPRIGIALSGGGFRAMLTEAGVLKAFKDEPDQPANQFRGLLESSHYISALSGGAYLLGSWMLYDYPSIDKLKSSWPLADVMERPFLNQWLDNADVCFPIQCETARKNSSGAPVSYADNYNRLMYRLLVKGVPANTTWGSISRTNGFRSGKYPYPIVLTNGQTAGENGISGLMTIYEMTPFEFGSWDIENTNAFIAIEHMGTEMSGGMSQGSCMVGLDNAAFIIGSSALAIGVVAEPRFGLAGSTGNLANPFCNFSTGTENKCDGGIGSYNNLYLVDGGTDSQNVPFIPLLQQDRDLDTIIAVDASSDEEIPNNPYFWPFGLTLNYTRGYAVSSKGQQQNLAFPNSTMTYDFIISHPQVVYTPTFFGCDPKDTTSEKGVVPPIIVYLPSNPYSAYPNSSSGSWGWCTWGGSVTDELVQNGVELATHGNPAASRPWAVCLACAVAERSRQRAGIQKRTPDCESCFADYCAETKPSILGLFDEDGNYAPPPLAGATKGSGTYWYNDTRCSGQIL